MSDQLAVSPSTGDNLESALQELIVKYTTARHLRVDPISTYHSLASLLEQMNLRIETMDAVILDRERDFRLSQDEVAKSFAREQKLEEENERLVAALATVKKMIELISGIRDTHHDREAQMLLVTRFITDALNPISPDDFSDIPF